MRTRRVTRLLKGSIADGFKARRSAAAAVVLCAASVLGGLGWWPSTPSARSAEAGGLSAGTEPGLAFSTYLPGGGGQDWAWDMQVDEDGYIFVGGQTDSDSFPDPHGGQAPGHGFVMKMDPTGRKVIWKTSLPDRDGRATIDVDKDGDAYYSGRSPFVTKLDGTDGSVIYRHRFAGDDEDIGGLLAVDMNKNVYVASNTTTPGQGTPGAFREQIIGQSVNAVVKKMDPAGAIVYSTYLGGNNDTWVMNVSVSPDGKALYLTGRTDASDLPIAGGYQSDANGTDGFLTRINPEGRSDEDLDYSTYLGGGSHDQLWGLATTADGRAHVSGQTESSNYPVKNGFPPPGRIVFSCCSGTISVIDTERQGEASLVYSGYMQAPSIEETLAFSVAIDSRGYSHIGGFTASENFPATPDAYQTLDADGIGQDAFVWVLDPDEPDPARSLKYASYLGSPDGEGSNGIAVAVGPCDGTYLAGWASRNFPVESGFPGESPYASSPSVSSDGFVASFTLPVVDRIEPATGPTSGGTRVKISGGGFTPENAAVFFDGQPAKSFRRVSCNLIEDAVTPPHAFGTAKVQVQGLTGLSGIRPLDKGGIPRLDTFTYIDSPGLPNVDVRLPDGEGTGPPGGNPHIPGGGSGAGDPSGLLSGNSAAASQNAGSGSVASAGTSSSAASSGGQVVSAGPPPGGSGSSPASIPVHQQVGSVEPVSVPVAPYVGVSSPQHALAGLADGPRETVSGAPAHERNYNMVAGNAAERFPGSLFVWFSAALLVCSFLPTARGLKKLQSESDVSPVIQPGWARL